MVGVGGDIGRVIGAVCVGDWWLFVGRLFSMRFFF